MATCNCCGKIVSSKATVCPNCGEPDPSSLTFWQAIIGIFIFVVIIGSCADKSKSVETTSVNSNSSSNQSVNFSGYSQRVIGSQELNVRNGPGVEYEIVGKVYLGDILVTYEQDNGWTRIGQDQWVKSNYLETY
jgi:uncharacterized protein YgiM (DUF1202 family)